MQNTEQPKWRLTELIIAKMIGETINDPAMTNFVESLDEVNVVAEKIPAPAVTGINHEI